MKNNTVAHPSAVRTIYFVCLMLCCWLAPLHGPIPSCQAQTLADTADNQTLPVTFISLKPGSTIGTSILHLHADGTLEIIEYDRGHHGHTKF